MISELLRGFTIRTRMISAIAMVLTLLTIVGAVGLWGLARIASLSDEFSDTTHADTVRLAQLRTSLGDTRRYEKDMIINVGAPDKLSEYQAKWLKAVEGVRTQSAAIAADGHEDEGSQAAKAMLQHIAAYQEGVAPVAKLLAMGGSYNISELNDKLKPARTATHEIEKLVQVMQKHIDEEAIASDEARRAAGRQGLLFFCITLGLCVAVVVPLTLANMASIRQPIEQARQVAERIATGDLCASVETSGQDETAKLLRALGTMQQSLLSMVGQVREAAENIQVASSEVATGNQDLSQRTEQTASNLQQAASSMEQLTGTVRQSADSASTANQLATSAAQVAQRGGEVVSQVVSTMDEINASSKKISDIIGVIDGIAFQTNILALNAAVEAARAGEQGRGFAVVASEVRSLAGRSAEAAREIKSLIGASVERVEAGSRLVADAGQTMNEIVGSVQRVTDIIGEITAAAAEQSSGIGQINVSVVQLDQMTQQNAALVEQSAAAAESLKDQATRLSGVVSSFKLPGGSHRAAPPTHSTSSAISPSKPSKPTPSAVPPAPKRVEAPPPQALPSAPSASSKAGDDWETF